MGSGEELLLKEDEQGSSAFGRSEGEGLPKGESLGWRGKGVIAGSDAEPEGEAGSADVYQAGVFLRSNKRGKSSSICIMGDLGT